MFDTSGVTDLASNELGKNRIWRQDYIEKSLFLLQWARGSSNILKWTESLTRRGFWTNIYLTQGTKHYLISYISFEGISFHNRNAHISVPHRIYCTIVVMNDQFISLDYFGFFGLVAPLAEELPFSQGMFLPHKARCCNSSNVQVIFAFHEGTTSWVKR